MCLTHVLHVPYTHHFYIGPDGKHDITYDPVDLVHVIKNIGVTVVKFLKGCREMVQDFDKDYHLRLSQGILHKAVSGRKC